MSMGCELLESRRLLNAGQLDPSFGSVGHIQHSAGSGIMLGPLGMAVAEQGQIVFAAAERANSSNSNEAKVIDIWRVLADGSIDPHFGDPASGHIALSLPAEIQGTSGPVPRATLRVTPPDQGVLLQYGRHLFKFRSDGAPDLHFGRRGELIVKEFTPTSMTGADVDASGDVYVIGGSTVSYPNTIVRRFNADGTDDTSFGRGGRQIVAGAQHPKDLAVRALADGNVVVGGLIRPVEPTTNVSFPVADLVARRLKSNGSIDAAYGTNGKAMIPEASNDISTVGVSLAGIDTDGAMYFSRTVSTDLGTDLHSVTYFSADGTPKSLTTQTSAEGDVRQRNGSLIFPIRSGLGWYDAATGQPFTTAITASAGALSGISFGSSVARVELAPDNSVLVLGSQIGVSGPIALTVHRLFGDDSPAAQLNAPGLRAVRSGRYQFKVLWRDDDAVDVSTLGDDDLSVLLPDGTSRSVKLISASTSTNARQVTATYALTSRNGTWGPRDNGSYTVRVQKLAVRDVHGNAAERRSIGVFRVQIPTR